MNKIEESLLTIKESLPTNYLPKIPKELEPRLKVAYSRYEHLIGIILGDFNRAEIEEDKQKYQYLLSPEKDELPVFGRKECVEYMHKKSGIDYKYCAVQMYQEYINLVASGFIKGEEREQIEAEYYLTLNSIEEFSEKPK